MPGRSSGDRPKDHHSSVQGRRAILRSMIPPVILVARRRVFKDVDLTADNRVIPERWEGFGRAADLVIAAPDGPWPWLRAAIRLADLVVIHGDGAMVGEGIIPRTDLFLAYLAHERLDTPVVLVNHSADFDRPELRRMAEHVYPLFADVVFRDPVSATRWGHLGGGRFAADSAFWFTPAGRDAWVPLAGRPTYFDVWPDTAPFDPAAPYLCLGGSSLHSTAWRPLELARSYAALVARLRAVYGGQILLTRLRPPGAGGLSAAGPRARPAAGRAHHPCPAGCGHPGQCRCLRRWALAQRDLRPAGRCASGPAVRQAGQDGVVDAGRGSAGGRVRCVRGGP